MKDKTFIAEGKIANKFGNITYRENSNGVKCLYIADFAPVYGDEDKRASAYIPLSVICGRMNSSAKIVLLIMAIADKLRKLADGLSRDTARQAAVETVLRKIGIRATYTLCKEGEVYTDEEGNELTYSTDWYKIDPNIVFVFGELKDALLKCNADAFIDADEDDVIA